MLGSAVIVAWALIIGGVAILVIEKLREAHRLRRSRRRLDLAVDRDRRCIQCLAMIPGVSRSGATILGAMAMGVDRKTAAEFSFFLAVPTLSGATALQLFKHWDEIPAASSAGSGLAALISFVVAIVVVKAFIAIITRFGFAPFAWYRIVAGAAALVWLGNR